MFVSVNLLFPLNSNVPRRCGSCRHLTRLQEKVSIIFLKIDTKNASVCKFNISYPQLKFFEEALLSIFYEHKVTHTLESRPQEPPLPAASQIGLAVKGKEYHITHFL